MSWEDEERRLEERLIRLYEQAEREIVAHIQRMTASGADPAKTISQLSRQRRQVEAILKKLRTASVGWSKRATVAAYTAGVSQAQQQMVAAGVAILPDLGGIHQPAMKIFAEKVRSRLMDVCTLAGRTTVDIYRAASLEASMVGSVAGYETWQQARRKILEEVTGRGIFGFVDRAGKKWSMKTYAEMLSRTALMEVHNEAQWREFRAHDEDLIVISFHTGTCPRCAPWAGKVLSLTGQTSGYPTLDDAKAGGLFHPRCRHASALYIPDEDETPEETERRMSAHRQEITAREEGRRQEMAEKEAKERADKEREKQEKADTRKEERRRKVSEQKQRRHVEGTKEHAAYAEKLAKKGMKPSVITISIEELQKIINEREGEWRQVSKDGNTGERWEVILNRIVGLWYDKRGIGPVESNALMIIASSSGSHAFPRWPSRGVMA